MADSFAWTCPYCGRVATITESNTSVDQHLFSNNNKDGHLSLKTHVIVCPNKLCRECQIVARLFKRKDLRGLGNYEISGEPLITWNLKPSSFAKVLPSYIPGQIVQDYNEACLIATLSPKASATLSRRCLQGMINDFWSIKKNRLVDAINAIQDKVDPITWQAIDAVRSIGNIGAHMEKDINLIIDVDPEEATLLIGLIETLLEEWYVHQHEREIRMQKVIDAAASKKVAKLEGKPSS